MEKSIYTREYAIVLRMIKEAREKSARETTAKTWMLDVTFVEKLLILFLVVCVGVVFSNYSDQV